MSFFTLLQYKNRTLMKQLNFNVHITRMDYIIHNEVHNFPHTITYCQHSLDLEIYPYFHSKFKPEHCPNVFTNNVHSIQKILHLFICYMPILIFWHAAYKYFL